VAGAALGAAYFGALWATLSRLPGSARPLRLAGLSLLLRLALLAGGLILIAGGDAGRMIAGLLGVLLARDLLARRIAARPGGAGSAPAATEAR